MKEKYPLKFTFGQIIFFVVSVLAAGVFDFYLGARFGPELLWGIKFDPENREPLLPEESSDAELEALLEEEGSRITFHEVLEKDTGDLNTPPAVKPKKKAKSPPKEKELKPSPINAQVLEKKDETELKIEKLKKEIAATKQAVLNETKEEETDTLKKEIAKNVKSATYTLQIGSFAKLTEAKAMLKKFSSRGYSAYLKEVTLPEKGKWYRVRLGRYTSKEAALQGRDAIARNFKIVPVVIKITR